MRQLGDLFFVKVLGFSVMLSSILSFALIIVVAVWGYRKVLDFLEDVVGGSITLANHLIGMVAGALKGFFSGKYDPHHFIENRYSEPKHPKFLLVIFRCHQFLGGNAEIC